MKNTTTINIQNEANINAVGELNTGNCKPVICLGNGMIFTSVSDAARHFGVYPQNMSLHLTGKRSRIKGMRFCYLSRVNDHLDEIATNLRESAANEEKARKWDAYVAEQERIRLEEERRLEAERIAKEKHEAAVAKADAKIERRKAVCQRLQKQLTEANKRLAKAVEERAELDL